MHKIDPSVLIHFRNTKYVPSRLQGSCCWQWLAGPWRGEVVDPPASHWAPQPPRTGFVESKYFSRIVVDSPSTIEEAVGMSVDFPEGALYRVPPNPKPCQWTKAAPRVQKYSASSRTMSDAAPEPTELGK